MYILSPFAPVPGIIRHKATTISMAAIDVVGHVVGVGVFPRQCAAPLAAPARMIQSINKVNEELGGYNDGSCSLQAPPIYVDVCISQKIARDPTGFLCFIDKDFGQPKMRSIDDP